MKCSLTSDTNIIDINGVQHSHVVVVVVYKGTGMKRIKLSTCYKVYNNINMISMY